mgnify:CR=1 FL=1|tara:strand:+ start:1134 stop:1643 length:510 start_codon:yes stop_codon:yes gene_type:complete
MAKAKLKKKKDSKKSSVKKGVAKVSKGMRGRGKSSARQSRLAQIFNPAFNVKTTREAEKLGGAARNIYSEKGYHITGDLRRPTFNAGPPPKGTLPLMQGNLGGRGTQLNRDGKFEISSIKGVNRAKTDAFNLAFSSYLQGRRQSAVQVGGKTYKASFVKDNVMLKPVLT